MCIRDRLIQKAPEGAGAGISVVSRRDGAISSGPALTLRTHCLLYTSDAADERSSVDLGGRRIIKKKKNKHLRRRGKAKKQDRGERIE